MKNYHNEKNGFTIGFLGIDRTDNSISITKITNKLVEETKLYVIGGST